jgi:membrane protease YdiL (CAAX protease family)
MENNRNPLKKNISEIFSLLFICFGLGTALSALWISALEIPFSSASLPYLTEKQALSLGWANAIQQFFFFLAPWLWFRYRSPQFNAEQKSGLHFNDFKVKNTRIIFLLIALLTITSFGWIESLSGLNHFILESLPSLKNILVSKNNDALIIQEKILSQNTMNGILQTIFLMSIVPGFLEEIFFRGLILHWLKQKINVHAAIWLVGLLFSIIHFEWEGFIPRWALGAGLGYVYHCTGKLCFPILAHVGNNLISIALFHYFQALNTPHDHWASNPMTWLVSTILFFGLVVLFYRKTQVLNKP